MIATPKLVDNFHFGNLPVLRYQWQEFTIEGYSRAAVQTYWRFPELKLLMDQGAHSWDFAGVSDLCITHLHPDHCAGLISYISTRSIMRSPPARIYLDAQSIGSIEELLSVWRRITGDELPCKLIGCRPGDTIQYIRSKEIEVFRSSHVIPTLGWMINDIRRKLKPEYRTKTGAEIRDLRLSGVEVTQTEKKPILSFCGDTTIDVLATMPKLKESRILILEMTFLGDEIDRARAQKFGHIHLNDFLDIASELKNELIVGSHFSSRWSRDEILKILNERLPLSIQERFVAWI